MDKQYVLSKLNIKHKLDPEFRAHGVEYHHYKLCPPIEEGKLETLEQEYEIELPEEYRQFILNIGNGGAGPSYGLYSIQGVLTGKKDPTYYQHYPWPEAGDEIRQKFVRPDEETDDCLCEAEKGAIILCQHGCGHNNYLVINGGEKGMVWRNIDWEGYFSLVPMLKDPIDWAYINKLPKDQKAHEEVKWAYKHLAVEKEERMSFNDWYAAWLEETPYIRKRPN